MSLNPNPKLLLSFTMWDIIFAVLGFLYVMITIALSKKWHSFLISKGFRENQAIFSSRKFLHIWSAGVMSLLVPFLFSAPLIPLIMGIVLALFTYLPHRKGELMDWFQVKENIAEVYFCLMWGVTIYVMWVLFNNPWYGALVTLYFSVGDAIAGEIRNFVYGYKTKSVLGNIGMFLFCAPISYIAVGWIGIVASLAVTLVELYEGLDDDLTIPITAILVFVLYGLLF